MQRRGEDVGERAYSSMRWDAAQRQQGEFLDGERWGREGGGSIRRSVDGQGSRPEVPSPRREERRGACAGLRRTADTMPLDEDEFRERAALRTVR